jgi:hypothetical protein
VHGLIAFNSEVEFRYCSFIGNEIASFGFSENRLALRIERCFFDSVPQVMGCSVFTTDVMNRDGPFPYCPYMQLEFPFVVSLSVIAAFFMLVAGVVSCLICCRARARAETAEGGFLARFIPGDDRKIKDESQSADARNVKQVVPF